MYQDLREIVVTVPEEAVTAVVTTVEGRKAAVTVADKVDITADRKAATVVRDQDLRAQDNLRRRGAVANDITKKS